MSSNWPEVRKTKLVLFYGALMKISFRKKRKKGFNFENSAAPFGNFIPLRRSLFTVRFYLACQNLDAKGEKWSSFADTQSDA